MAELHLKYIRPTKVVHGHTDVYYEDKCIGYFLKTTYDRLWHFVTCSRVRNMTAANRKNLLVDLAKELEKL